MGEIISAFFYGLRRPRYLIPAVIVASLIVYAFSRYKPVVQRSANDINNIRNVQEDKRALERRAFDKLFDSNKPDRK